MKKVALIRGKFITKYDMSIFEEISDKFDFTVFSSKSTNVDLKIPQKKLLSPMDLPNFPYKMQVLNRILIDAHYLNGLEENLKGFDIAHTSETYFNFTRQALNAKREGYVKAVVCTVFENIPFNNERICGRKNFKNRAIEEVDKFIAVTQEVKETLIKEGVNSKKIEVIGMGIDTNKFKPNPNKKYDKKKINILFVGRIEVFKGIFDVLEVFHKLSQDNDLSKYELNLTIVGKGSKEKEMKEQIKKLNLSDKVTWDSLPYDSINNVYRKADIFMGPSRQDKYWKEQFGMVFLEAMSSGLPIVSYKIGSIPEVVGKDGFLVKTGDVQGLRVSIKKLILDKNLRKEYSKKSRSRAVNKFSLKIVSKQIEKIYKSL